MQDVASHVLPQDQVLTFITAGNATFTVVFTEENKRYTYKAVASDDQKYLWIKVLTGPDNTNNYTQIYLFHVDENGAPILRFWKNNRLYETSPSVVAFKRVFKHLLLRPDEPIEGVEFWHVGRCCRCGRILTVPESIASGIGPECATKINAFTI